MTKEITSTKRETAEIFSNNKAIIYFELSVLDSTKSAKEMAEITAKDMRRQKLSVSDPVEVANGFYAMEVDGGPMPYRCWIGANGMLDTITSIIGKLIGSANEILKAVRTSQPNMFPLNVK